MKGLYANKITDIDLLGLGEIKELDKQLITQLDEIMSLLKDAEIKQAYTLLDTLRHDTATHIEEITLAEDYISMDMERSTANHFQDYMNQPQPSHNIEVPTWINSHE